LVLPCSDAFDKFVTNGIEFARLVCAPIWTPQQTRVQHREANLRSSVVVARVHKSATTGLHSDRSS
jgi:hypothetical protein